MSVLNDRLIVLAARLIEAAVQLVVVLFGVREEGSDHIIAHALTNIVTGALLLEHVDLFLGVAKRLDSLAEFGCRQPL